MAPSGTTTRRVDQDHHHQGPQHDNGVDADMDELFVDPMLGIPLQMYIEKEVQDKETICKLVMKYGGIVAPGYSGVPYVLVDPNTLAGQNLWRQYNNKKGKIILNAEWVKKCVESRQLLTYQDDWGGYRVTGKEATGNTMPTVQPTVPRHLQGLLEPPEPDFPHPSTLMGPSMPPPIQIQIQEMPPAPPMHMITPMTVHSLIEQQAVQQVQVQVQPDPQPPPEPTAGPSTAPFPFPVFAAVAHQVLEQEDHGASQAWQESGLIAPSQTHLHPPPPPPPPDPSTIQEQAHAQGQAEASTSTVEHPTSMAPHLFHHRPPPETTWNGYDPTAPQDPISFEFRADTSHWDPYYAAYYGPSYLDDPATNTDPTHHTSGPGVPPVAHVPPAPPPPAPILGTGPNPNPDPPVPRGRKKARNITKSTTPTAHLVPSKGPPTRSPSPPARVLRSTYGGNLFTAEDVMYLKRYIDYCQDQGLVLSLREICERIAIKAPHHTFYSWRRYCNKHQIRLGGYSMTAENEDSPMDEDDQDPLDEEDPAAAASILSSHSASNLLPSLPIGVIMSQILPMAPRDRSPTPPRALFRSTTGKGVAFTNEDIAFLIKFMEHRKSQGRLDMIQFWREVAAKAPHHSRASWMKYWRRHKHEFEAGVNQPPLPQPPEKKMRYSREDDVLLAKYFYGKPEGTSDSVFQAFGRLYPHHPWKGWQEHHRIHKAKIDHLIERLNYGDDIDIEGPAG